MSRTVTRLGISVLLWRGWFYEVVYIKPRLVSASDRAMKMKQSFVTRDVSRMFSIAMLALTWKKEKKKKRLLRNLYVGSSDVIVDVFQRDGISISGRVSMLCVYRIRILLLRINDGLARCAKMPRKNGTFAARLLNNYPRTYLLRFLISWRYVLLIASLLRSTNLRTCAFI